MTRVAVATAVCGCSFGEETCGQPATHYIEVAFAGRAHRLYRCEAHADANVPHGAVPTAAGVLGADADALVEPIAGERVLEVPQAYSYLLSPHDARSIIGRSAEDAGRLVSEHGPRVISYRPQRDPATGYGLIVLRDGRCRRGPTRWDSGD